MTNPPGSNPRRPVIAPLGYRRPQAGLLAITVVLLTALLPALMLKCGPPRRGPPSPQPPPPTVEQIQQLSDLVVLRVAVVEVVQSRLEGLTGSAQANAIVRGVIMIGTDLGAAQFVERDLRTRRAVLVVPAPRPVSVAVDLETSVFEPVTYTGLWAATLCQTAERQAVADRLARAQSMLTDVAADPRWAAQAKARAEQVLAGFVEGLGWTLQIQWGQPASGPAGLD